MKIMVMDGQGGGIGAAIIKALRQSMGSDAEIYALGTNSIATSGMMKAGANRGATGENPIVKMSEQVDLIVGPLAIMMANSMMGEVTPKMAVAVGSSPAKKILIPLTQEHIEIIGVLSEPLPHLVEKVVNIIQEKQDV